ncbi:MAG: lipid IV(A) 3-deoxy-D-manno-octulosonic acid transferase [Halioglobus sp.]
MPRRSRMIRHAYSALFYLLVPILILRMLWRSRLAPEYRKRLRERFGLINTTELDPAKDCLWVHAVSVGEVLAAAPVIEHLLSDYPQYQVVVTTTTPTGSERVLSLFGRRVFHVYAPWDLPGSCARFVRHVRPKLLIILETELWPNMIHHVVLQGAKILLANARLSERSARGYARVESLTADTLGQLDCVACQTQADGDRFHKLGLLSSRLRVTGSIKYDIHIDEVLRASSRTLRQQLAADTRPVVVAASTHPGEESQILEAFAELREHLPNCLLVIVPRHPERFDAVFKQCRDARWTIQRRTQAGVIDARTDILLGDTMGELLLLLSTADVAVIGGSLVPHGGHNVLEAAVWGVPAIAGPHMFNFADVSERMVKAGAMIQLSDSRCLSQELSGLLQDQHRLQQMSVACQQVLQENRGAREQLLGMIEELLSAVSR